MNKFIIYSKKRCSYCVAAKSLLNSKNIKFIEKMVDESEVDFNEMKNKAPNMRTLPVILCDDQLVGGYHELINFLNE
tara:strand:+ start:775 stop:1005 length:231 start_codon:yes stop_codon:yes gene_type:complete